MQGTLTDDARQFRAPQTMTPDELGDNLARLVWESFSDFLAREDVETPLPDVDTLDDDDGTALRTAEEALIFFMWAHTRGAQLAFLGRAPEQRIKEGLDALRRQCAVADAHHGALDALHSAVFEDMVENGTPKSQLPLFEQRVGARYAEYHQAAAESDDKLGAAVSRHMLGQVRDSTSEAIRERAVAVANPLRDFLEEVELVES